jgi:hypothetical protein
MVFTHSRDNPQTNNTLFINETRKFQILITVTPVRAWPPCTVLTLSDIDEWAALK